LDRLIASWEVAVFDNLFSQIQTMGYFEITPASVAANQISLPCAGKAKRRAEKTEKLPRASSGR